MGKDKLYGVGRGEHVSLAREGTKVKIIAIFICFGGSGGFVPMFLVLVHALLTCRLFSKSTLTTLVFQEFRQETDNISLAT